MFALGEEFLNNLENNRKSVYTIRNYKRNLNLFYKWFFKVDNIDNLEMKDIKKIKSTDIDEFKVDMEENKGYKRTYINNIVATLTSFYRYLGKVDEEVVNEARKSGVMVEHRAKRDFLEKDEAEALLEVADKDDETKDEETNVRNRLILNLFLNTGIRYNELAHLKFKNLIEKDNYLVFFGKGNKERGLYLSDKVMNLFKRWKQIRKNMRCVLKEDEEYIFLSKKRTTISNVQMNRIVKEYCKKAGITKNISTHKLRHTFATLMLKEAGIEIEKVADLMGHSSPMTTLRYTHITDDTKKLTRFANPLFNK